MDDCDKASEYEQKWLQAQLDEHAYQLSHAVSAFEAGRCRNCDDKLDDGRNYCDTECAKDYEQRLKSIKRRGRI